MRGFADDKSFVGWHKSANTYLGATAAKIRTKIWIFLNIFAFDFDNTWEILREALPGKGFEHLLTFFREASTVFGEVFVQAVVICK